MSDHNFLVSDNCAALDLWLLSVLACCFYHRTWLICFPNSKRSIWLRAGGCFHQRAWRFLYPKLQLPCREPLISSLWLQHHAFNLRPRIQTKILMSCFQGPRFEFQFQVHGVVSCRPTPLFVICDLFQAMAWVLLGGPCKLELL